MNTETQLTWQDIKQIVKIADDLIPCTPFVSVSEQIFADEFQTEESYYTEILKRFNGQKKKSYEPSWEDVQDLYIITKKYMYELDHGDLSKFPSSSREMFEEIIRRFKEGKQ